MRSEWGISEFKPAIRFVLLFLAIYVAGNSLYGVWIENTKPAPDAATVTVSRQVSWLLSPVDQTVSTLNSETEPVVMLRNQHGPVLRVFEGCNGVNVMIVFVSFMIAIGGRFSNLAKFTIGGLLVIHVANLLRVFLLFITAIYQPRLFYYFHKYLFTAVLYAVVFALWYVWIEYFIVRPKKNASGYKSMD
ncbi:MAG TPA: exosortase family protein XrtF [Cyclobacteriaceae bacterium]|nr:exosortase family protein XrtF [Cyclobacteriaceae bacterium]